MLARRELHDQLDGGVDDDLGCDQAQTSRSTSCGRLVRRPPVASPFERLSSFQPESYTGSPRGPILFSYFAQQMDSSDCVRKVRHTMLYANTTSRQWVRLVLTIEMTYESAYWAVEKPQLYAPQTKRCAKLARSIAAAVQRFLLECQDSHQQRPAEQDCHLSMYLGAASHNLISGEHPVPIWFLEPDDDNIRYLEEITARVRHWGCDSYSSRDLVQRPLDPKEPSYRFAAYLKSRWVFQTMFGGKFPRIRGRAPTLHPRNV